VRELLDMGRAAPFAALLLILSCAAHSEAGITASLLAQRPVCLTLEWGTGRRGTFYSQPAPDTLTLLPDPGKAYTGPEPRDAWGLIRLAPTQQDRRGGGWWWMLAGDTLTIRGDNPTMDGLAIWAVRPDEQHPASWEEFGLTSEEHSARGRVGLRRYGCGEPTDSTIGLVTIYKARRSGFTGTVREVVRDSSRWRAVWDSSGGRDARDSIPAIDFRRSMLVVAAGPRGGPGDAVLINQVTESGKTLHVRVTAYQHCSPLQMITEPVHVVRVRRSQRKAVFENRLVRGSNCLLPR
jgi:hypothetical protein